MNPQTETAIRGLSILIGTSLLVKRGLITDSELQQYLGFGFVLFPILWAQAVSFFRTKSIKEVQINLGVKPDGVPGPVTIEAAKNSTPL